MSIESFDRFLVFESHFWLYVELSSKHTLSSGGLIKGD